MTTEEVAAAAGISYRQLDHWVRRGLIDGPEAKGSGRAREWTAQQAAVAIMTGRLVNAGIEVAAASWLTGPLLTDGRAKIGDGLWLSLERSEDG